VNGRVYRRGKYWAYVFEAGVDPATGKRRRRHKSGFKTQRAAEAAKREAIRAAETGMAPAGELPTVASYVDEWLAGRRSALRQSTWASYRDVLEGRVVSRLGALRLDKLTAKHVADLAVDLEQHGGRDERRGPGLSARSVRYTLTVLTRALDDAVKRGLIPRNPAEHVDRPRVADKEMEWWSIGEARTFLNYTADDRLSALWTLLLTTGLRRGEALGLKWDDIHFDAGRLAVRRTLVTVGYQIRWSEPKTQASRRAVALDPGTVTTLRAHRARQLEERLAVGAGYLDQGLVFCDVAGEPLHPDGVTQRFDRLVRNASLRRIRLHDLRHTAATLMLEAGVPLKAVAERLGHSSTRTTTTSTSTLRNTCRTMPRRNSARRYSGSTRSEPTPRFRDNHGLHLQNLRSCNGRKELAVVRQKKRGDSILSRARAGDPDAVRFVERRKAEGVTAEDIRGHYNTSDRKRARTEHNQVFTWRLLFMTERERLADEGAATESVGKMLPFYGEPDEPEGIHEGLNRPLYFELLHRIEEWVRRQGLNPKNATCWLELRSSIYPQTTINGRIRSEMEAGRL
jgi:integrase